MASYYIVVNGEAKGPYTIDELRQAGLQSNSLVWTETMTDWAEASTVNELADIFKPYTPGADQQPQYFSTNQQYPPFSPVYQHLVPFGEAIQRIFSNYTNFSGRASLSEYWFAVLFYYIVSFGMSFLMVLMGNHAGFILYIAVALFFVIPMMALSVRRLHDSGRSGWNLLLSLIPFIGGIILLVYFCAPSEMKENRYGPVPNCN